MAAISKSAVLTGLYSLGFFISPALALEKTSIHLWICQPHVELSVTRAVKYEEIKYGVDLHIQPLNVVGVSPNKSEAVDEAKSICRRKYGTTEDCKSEIICDQEEIILEASEAYFCTSDLSKNYAFGAHEKSAKEASYVTMPRKYGLRCAIS